MLTTLTLAEAKRITLLMMRGCRDRVRSLFEELVHLFNDRYPDRPIISVPNVGYLEQFNVLKMLAVLNNVTG